MGAVNQNVVRPDYKVSFEKEKRQPILDPDCEFIVVEVLRIIGSILSRIAGNRQIISIDGDGVGGPLKSWRNERSRLGLGFEKVQAADYDRSRIRGVDGLIAAAALRRP